MGSLFQRNLAFLAVAALSACASETTTPVAENSNAVEFTVQSLLENGGRQLSDAELEALFVGKTIDHVHRKNGKIAVITHNPDGNREVTWEGKTYSDTSYEIRGNQRCEISIGDGKENCMTVIAFEDQTILCDPRHDGECNWLIKP